MDKKIKVLVVDDSALVRQCFIDITKDVDDIEIIGTANDPFKAAELLSKGIVPDVIILDIEMPKMDGITFLKKIMSQHPIPTIICSKLAEDNPDVTLEALKAGAVEVIAKPQAGTKKFLYESNNRILNAIRGAAKFDLNKMKKIKSQLIAAPKLTADAVIKKDISTLSIGKINKKIIAIGASTGGTEAIEFLIREFPDYFPGIVIVQHMPVKFTKSFAERLDRISKLGVKEAEDGDIVKQGMAYIAPGDKHMLVYNEKGNYKINIKDGPLVRRHRPSVDVLFRSVAQCSGKEAIAVLLTGMGDDGAQGLKEIKESGGFTIAQDESTSVVFGMPKEAIKIGGATEVLPLNKITERISEYLNKNGLL
jgi:two-component system chemotaxis response regulator CheB